MFLGGVRPACAYTRRMHWLGRLGCSLGTVLLLGACPAPEDEGDDDIESGRTTHAPPTTSATSSGDSATTNDTATGSVTTSATSAGSSGGDTTGSPTTGIQPPFFDLGVPDSPEFDMGCRKVDFLFVIDNSGSMSAQQAQLLASFNGFITAIQDSLDESVDSYHVGVITSDAYSSNAPGCNTLGALVSQTQAGGDCTPFAGGGRYATEMDDLEVKFPCMAEVGAFGSGVEQPVTGAIAALGPTMSGAGQCNEGFLRDDAILVLVVLTDDPPAGTLDDANLGTDTSTWYDSIIAAKNGDPEALVVVGFVPWMDVGCVVFGIESPNLIAFVESFGDQGVLTSICEPDFGPAFAGAVSTIVSTCENFEPPA